MKNIFKKQSTNSNKLFVVNYGTHILEFRVRQNLLKKHK